MRVLQGRDQLLTTLGGPRSGLHRAEHCDTHSHETGAGKVIPLAKGEGVTNGGGNFYFLKGKTNKILPFLLAVVISLALMDR